MTINIPEWAWIALCVFLTFTSVTNAVLNVEKVRLMKKRIKKAKP